MLPDPLPTAYIGQMGLKRYFFNNTNAVKIENWESYVGTEEEDSLSLWTVPEIQGEELFLYTVSAFTGYFRAPADGDYRFFMVCDDNCNVRMSLTEPLSPAAKEEILFRPRWTSFRNFPIPPYPIDGPDQGRVYSKWITLTEGQHYYMDTSMKNYGGPGHVTVGMEAKLVSPPAYHPNAVS